MPEDGKKTRAVRKKFREQTGRQLILLSFYVLWWPQHPLNDAIKRCEKPTQWWAFFTPRIISSCSCFLLTSISTPERGGRVTLTPTTTSVICHWRRRQPLTRKDSKLQHPPRVTASHMKANWKTHTFPLRTRLQCLEIWNFSVGRNWYGAGNQLCQCSWSFWLC